MRSKILACLLAAVLIACLGATVASAPVTSPDIKSIEVTYYAKSDNPVKPDKPPGKPPKEEEPPPPVDNTCYELLGLELTGTATYVVNPKGAPTGAIAEIKDAFEAWDGVTAAELFADTVGTTTAVGWSEDGENTVSWVGIIPRSIVAIAVIWYVPYTDGDGLGEIVEFDITFNALQKWGIDGEKRAFDVRNVATHEVGHVVGLADLYEDLYRELTMYGYTSKGETIKISLEEGDILGVQYLYPEPFA